MKCENIENNILCEQELKRGSEIYVNGMHVCATCFKFLKKRKKALIKQKCQVEGCPNMVRKRQTCKYTLCKDHYYLYSTFYSREKKQLKKDL